MNNKSENDTKMESLETNEGEYKENFSNFDSNLNLTEKDVIEAVKKVFDPEIPVNINDLGLIYNIEIINNFDVIVTMTLTTPNCPVAKEMPSMVGNAIKNLKGFKSASIKIVWEPPWTKDMMSEDAKLALDIT